jgi:TPR repeat protein
MDRETHDKIPDAEQLFLKAEQFEEKNDLRNAFKCLLAGAQLGDTGSQLNLGNFYASGKGTRKSLEKAAYWYKEAYNNGYSTAALNLAIDRRNQGNVRSAVVWFKKAIAMGDGEACIALAKIYKSRKGGQKAAAGLLKRALRLNRDCISEAGREEAESLLRAISKDLLKRQR